jgi:hypothetical protein
MAESRKETANHITTIVLIGARFQAVPFDSKPDCPTDDRLPGPPITCRHIARRPPRCGNIAVAKDLRRTEKWAASPSNQ